MRTLFIILTILCFSSASVSSQELTDLSWLTGYWTHTDNGVTTEELWTTDSGGLMIGFNRMVSGENEYTYEFLRIVQQKDKVIYLASPGGRPPTAFTLIESSGQRAVFESPENDFPHRIIYSREGDLLTARIEDQTGERSLEWVWEKTPFND